MTPGARLQAAIDILSTISDTSRPADRVFDGWARRSKFAGSKDRFAVSKLVFTVLRHRNELVTALNSEEPRLLVLGAISLIEAIGPEAAMTLIDGTRYAPSSLEPKETDILRNAALPDRNAPAHVRFNYPEWMHNEFKLAFGVRLEIEMAALMERAAIDLRVNILKSSRESVQAMLAKKGIDSDLTPFAPFGLRLKTHVNIKGLAAFHDGLLELQDEGSQITCLLTGAKPDEHIVDLCTGGGGKALALAAAMNNRGKIYACDTNYHRLYKLIPRAKRAGVRNIETRFIKPNMLSSDTDDDLSDIEARMDCVLLDVPCSGTGVWRRSPDARWRLTQRLLESYCVMQSDILMRGSLAVRPGGRLIYATCSLLPSENENQIHAFLNIRPDFFLAAWDTFWPKDNAPPSIPSSGGALHLTPASTGTDGFFVAIMIRKS